MKIPEGGKRLVLENAGIDAITASQRTLLTRLKEHVDQRIADASTNIVRGKPWYTAELGERFAKELEEIFSQHDEAYRQARDLSQEDLKKLKERSVASLDSRYRIPVSGFFEEKMGANHILKLYEQAVDRLQKEVAPKGPAASDDPAWNPVSALGGMRSITDPLIQDLSRTIRKDWLRRNEDRLPSLRDKDSGAA